MNEPAEKVEWGEKVLTVESAIQEIEALARWSMIGEPRSFMEIPYRTADGVKMCRLIYQMFSFEADTADEALRALVESVREKLVEANRENTWDQVLIFWRLPEKVGVQVLGDAGRFVARTRLDWAPRTTEQLGTTELLGAQL